MPLHSPDTSVLSPSAFEAAYAALFALAGTSLVAATVRARSLDPGEARTGLVVFLAVSATWAASVALRLAVDGGGPSAALYSVGSVAGIASVAAFSYFASAFAGRSYHRDPVVRAAAVAAFLVACALKLTNPINGAPAPAAAVATPLRYGPVPPGAVHLAVGAAAYVVAGAGLYLVYDTLSDAGHAGPRLWTVAAALPVPVALDAMAVLRSDLVIRTSYEPVGVAVFAIGLLWFVDGRPGAVVGAGRKHLVDQLDVPVCVVGDGRVRETNAPFAALVDGDAVGRPVEALPPRIAATLDGSAETLTAAVDGCRRRFRVSTSEVGFGPHRLGRAVVYTDVTDDRRCDREVDRQNRELENIGEAMAHELRNACAITAGHLERAREHAGATDDPAVRAAALDTAADGVDRIDRVVSQLETIVRDSRSVSSYERIDLAWSAERVCGPGAPPYSVDDDGTLVGDPVRVDHLLQNVFGLARAEAVDALAIRTAAGVLTLAFEGIDLPTTVDDDLFGYAQSCPTADSGLYLPTIRLIAHAHHWRIDARTNDGDTPTLTVRIDTDPDTPSAATADPSDTQDPSDRTDSVPTDVPPHGGREPADG